jgi:hypothetical protein
MALTEVDCIPASLGRHGNGEEYIPVTPLARFSVRTLKDFADARYKQAEVEGWPQHSNTAQRTQAIRNVIKRLGLTFVKVCQRQRRIFLERTGNSSSTELASLEASVRVIHPDKAEDV